MDPPHPDAYGKHCSCHGPIVMGPSLGGSSRTADSAGRTRSVDAGPGGGHRELPGKPAVRFPEEHQGQLVDEPFTARKRSWAGIAGKPPVSMIPCWW